ncbi:MAG: hypothetical protein A3A98_02750 [Candidatus Staskawiczbacteria bacterium RIFCSPLOWO2_01_FULL_40_39]|uniref:Uncharacterized protein n=1 Tax=Candidatus Staskawiczbacteria bacterium RIFCSPHIGHO2_01_FULL_39_25 TaxID=1802202 RepID=A0A1G2HN22_9BACT|nr:MAG: hypothetical protein A2730_03670 [Candidatus Staskawiczbacteria bacterium RIFCSPHIGHO2_01_FULL_39_25]OGZ73666.1 MAG: hypothetical protein A3A98_02750 [Candidatus Staskawiczbacteria bacterium RIFCSPLOWO2_01_FULL_40_39]OGZ75296.1 MAG: hypothetical protein A3I87_02080 [Candidatus Staskawiczbacteria bacterium RIFCSPLOWO2_02_FULL_39_8]
MDKERGFIKNIFIAATILGVVFLSQTPYFKAGAKNLYSQRVKTENPYFAGIGDWFKKNVYGRLEGVSGEVGKGTAALQDKIVEEKNTLAENSAGATKKFIAEKMLQAMGVKPEELIDQKDFCSQ